MKNTLKSIQYGLLDYIEGEENPDYSSADVTACIKLLLEFMATIMNLENQSEAAKTNSECTTALVYELVLSLNSLNDDCDGCLIASEEQEEITEFIEKVLLTANVEITGKVPW
jgi:hypothetical protein